MPAKIEHKFIIINDVSERKADKPLIEEFASDIYPFPRIVKASGIRRKVFNRLRYETKRRKYDLILLGDRGGTLLFSDPRLKDFGNRVRRMQYSMHALKKDWLSAVEKEAGSLGERPRILLLESDVGSAEHTAHKLMEAKRALLRARANAEVDIMAGIANKDTDNIAKYRYVASYVQGSPERLSELLEKYERYGRKGQTEALMALVRRKSLHTGRLPH